MSLITITYSFGSGGDDIARKVSEQLGIDLYDDRRLQEEAVKMGISGKDVKGLDEKAPGLFDRLLGTKPAIYLDLLGSLVYEMGRRGSGVIIGHGAQFFLKDFGCALHVRIDASAATRIPRLMKDQGMSREAAQRIIQKMDTARGEFVQFAFHRDWNDSAAYDLVVNLDKLSVDWATRLIVDLARSQEIKECSLKALEEMEMSSLQRKVDAAVVGLHLSATIHVDVPEKGLAHLTGWVQTGAEKDVLLKTVNQVPGLKKLKSDVFLMPVGY